MQGEAQRASSGCCLGAAELPEEEAVRWGRDFGVASTQCPGQVSGLVHHSLPLAGCPYLLFPSLPLSPFLLGSGAALRPPSSWGVHRPEPVQCMPLLAKPQLAEVSGGSAFDQKPPFHSHPHPHILILTTAPSSCTLTPESSGLILNLILPKRLLWLSPVA